MSLSNFVTNLLSPSGNESTARLREQMRDETFTPAGIYFEGISPTGQHYPGLRITGRSIPQLLAQRGMLEQLFSGLLLQCHGNYSLLLDVALPSEGTLSLEFFPQGVAGLVLHHADGSHYPQETYATLDEALYALHLTYGDVGTVPTPIPAYDRGY